MMEESGPCPVFAYYTLAFTLQLRKRHGNPCQGSRKAHLGTIQCVNMGTLRVARTSCRSRSPCFRGLGSTLGQRKYLPSYVTKGSHIS
jgi:hypothetical protein